MIPCPNYQDEWDDGSGSNCTHIPNLCQHWIPDVIYCPFLERHGIKNEAKIIEWKLWLKAKKRAKKINRKLFILYIFTLFLIIILFWTMIQ